MMTRYLIAFLAATLALSTGCCHHCRSYQRRPLLNCKRATCCEPTACCGYAAPVTVGPAMMGPVMSGPVMSVPSNGEPPIMQRP